MAAVRVEDIERALVLAREVASATAKGGAANLRMEHLVALFANGNGPPSPDRIEAALAAAGVSVEPALSEAPKAVSLRVSRGGAARRAANPPEPQPRLSGVDAYRAATGKPLAERPAAPAEPRPEGVSLADAQRIVASDKAQHNTPKALAALLPATIVPVLAASFLGPLFGASFAGLALLGSALLSRPGALGKGRMGPIRMPASLARSFLLVTFGVALGAMLTSVALVAAGRTDTETVDESAPIEQTTPEQPPATTPPAPPTAAERRAAARERRERAEGRRQRRERRERAERRRERRERAERRREREREAAEAEAEAADTPPSGGGQTPEPAPEP